MNAVRYYSKSGNTKKIAEAIAEGIGAKAISITDEPALEEKVEKDHFYAQMLMMNSKVKAAEEFGKRFAE